MTEISNSHDALHPPGSAGSPGPRHKRTLPSRPLLHSGLTVDRFFAMHFQGAIFPLTAGLLLFGWRALILVASVMGSAALATLVWQRLTPAGSQLRMAHSLWSALLLALLLPAHLMSASYIVAPGLVPPWALAPAAGIVLVFLIWLLGGVGSGRVHPVLLTYLLLMVLFGSLLVPHTVLHPSRIFVGDLTNVAPMTSTETTKATPWLDLPKPPPADALWRKPASQQLIFYTSGTRSPDRTWLPLIALLRDQMPPLEDFIVGGQPAPIGMGSAVAIIIGGLFLLYRGLIDYRIPLLIVLAAFVGFLVLPVPVVLTDVSAEYRWLALRWHGVGWQTAITFANYQILSGPLLLMAFFIATSPSLRPLTRRARILYALLIGLATAIFQLYASVSIGPYLALLVVSLLTPFLDHWTKPRPMV